MPLDTRQPSANPALYDFWDTHIAPDGLPVRYRVLYGGRGSSKSFDAATMALVWSKTFRGTFLCARRFHVNIHQSVYALLVDRIHIFGWQDEFDIQAKKIVNLNTGTEFWFYGIERNTAEIKSMHGVSVLWLEEANYVTQQQFEEILAPTVREEDSQIWLVFNPGLVTDYCWQSFVVNPFPGTVSRLINYTENPFLSNTARRDADNMRQRDEKQWRHIYLGEPREDNNDAVILYSWVQAAVNAHKHPSLAHLNWEPLGEGGQTGIDPAEAGNDAYGECHQDNHIITSAREFDGARHEILSNAKKGYDNGYSLGSRRFVYDAHGLGAPIGENLMEHRKKLGHSVEIVDFLANGKVWEGNRLVPGTKKLRDQFFHNAKAAAWYHAARLLENTYRAVMLGEEFEIHEMVSISAEIPQLTELKLQLSTPLKSESASGKYIVESKDDLKKRKVKSPNIADAFIMSLLPRQYKMRLPISEHDKIAASSSTGLGIGMKRRAR